MKLGRGTRPYALVDHARALITQPIYMTESHETREILSLQWPITSAAGRPWTAVLGFGTSAC